MCETESNYHLPVYVTIQVSHHFKRSVYTFTEELHEMGAKHCGAAHLSNEWPIILGTPRNTFLKYQCSVGSSQASRTKCGCFCFDSSDSIHSNALSVMGFFLIRTQDPRVLLRVSFTDLQCDYSGKHFRKIKFMISFDENDFSFNFIISLL